MIRARSRSTDDRGDELGYASDTEAGRSPPFGAFAPSWMQRAIMGAGAQLPRNYIGRRVSGWLRSLLQAISRNPVDIDVLGMKMRLVLHGNAGERRLAVTPQFFDSTELSVLASAVHDDFRFVDLGANVGVYSLFVATRAPGRCRVLAIEPHPAAIERLRENSALNGVEIEIQPFAVGDHEGTVVLSTGDMNFGTTTVHENYKGRGATQELEVPMRTLSTIVTQAGFDRIDALKADIEGLEDKALVPFFREAPEHLWPKLVIIEWNADRWDHDLGGELQSRGYRQIAKAKNMIMARQ